MARHLATRGIDVPLDPFCSNNIFPLACDAATLSEMGTKAIGAGNLVEGAEYLRLSATLLGSFRPKDNSEVLLRAVADTSFSISMASSLEAGGFFNEAFATYEVAINSIKHVPGFVRDKFPVLDIYDKVFALTLTNRDVMSQENKVKCLEYQKKALAYAIETTAADDDAILHRHIGISIQLHNLGDYAGALEYARLVQSMPTEDEALKEMKDSLVAITEQALELDNLSTGVLAVAAGGDADVEKGQEYCTLALSSSDPKVRELANGCISLALAKTLATSTPTPVTAPANPRSSWSTFMPSFPSFGWS